MTVRVTTLKGPLAGVYYVEQLPVLLPAGRRTPGVWLGRAADRLGLAGEVDDEAFLALMAGMDPRRPTVIWAAATTTRRSAASTSPARRRSRVSVLWALGDEDVRREVLAAHDAAVAAMVGLDRGPRPHPVPDRRRGRRRGRRGDRGGGVPAAHQPQRRPPAPHPCRDRQSGGIPGRPLAGVGRQDDQGRSAHPVGPVPRRVAGRADRPLGVAGSPRLGSPRSPTSPSVRVEFSQRTGEVQRRVDEKLDRFARRWAENRRCGNAGSSNAKPCWTAAHRSPRPSTAEVQHRRWADQTVTLGLDPADVVAGAVGRPVPAQVIDRWSGIAIEDQAMATITEGQSSWRPAELVRELAAAVPTSTSLDRRAAGRLAG